MVVVSGASFPPNRNNKKRNNSPLAAGVPQQPKAQNDPDFEANEVNQLPNVPLPDRWWSGDNAPGVPQTDESNKKAHGEIPRALKMNRCSGGPRNPR